MDEDLTGLPLPEISAETRDFWTGGADGRLLIKHCGDCGHWLHPPGPVCSRCHGRNLRSEAVSGRGRIASYTINRQPWVAGLQTPYILAIVELEEQEGLRLTTRIVSCPVEEVRIGDEVRVRFVPHGEIWLPFFEPA